MIIAFRLQELTRYANLNNDYTTGAMAYHQNSLVLPLVPILDQSTNQSRQRFNNINKFFQAGFAQNHNLSLDFVAKYQALDCLVLTLTKQA
jgi:hypothetical protein